MVTSLPQSQNPNDEDFETINHSEIASLAPHCQHPIQTELTSLQGVQYSDQFYDHHEVKIMKKLKKLQENQENLQKQMQKKWDTLQVVNRCF